MEFLKKFFYHQTFNAICGVVTIISLVVTVYFYLKSTKQPDLTCYGNPTRTPIVQQGHLNNFGVTFMGTPVTGDLSTAEIQIWNQGNSPIASNDILVPVSIRFLSNEVIYQASATTTRDVIGFHWLSPTNYPSKMLAFDWRILEQNDGIKIQMVYGGNVHAAIVVDSTIVGQAHIHQKTFLNSASGGQLAEVITITVIVLSFFGYIKFMMVQDKITPNKVDLFYLFVMICLIIYVGFYCVYNAQWSKPPFGF
jgi:hypothetical protein